MCTYGGDMMFYSFFKHRLVFIIFDDFEGKNCQVVLDFFLCIDFGSVLCCKLSIDGFESVEPNRKIIGSLSIEFVDNV